MTRRVVAVVVPRAIAAESLEAAMLDDVVDLVAGMQQVDAALVATPGGAATARAVAWPGMSVHGAEDGLLAALTVLAEVADEAAVIRPDAPDLPPLLVGKLFSALTTAEVALCPAADGDVIALASRLPLPRWLAAAGAVADGPDAAARLRQAAPPRALHVGSGWHRVRSVADARDLDEGLEGWEATRLWLSSRGP